MKLKSTLCRLAIAIIILLISQSEAFSQAKYWVNGSGSWNDSSHWSLVSGGKGGDGIPTINDDVIFNKYSFLTNENTVTIEGSAFCKNFIWKGTSSKHPIFEGNLNATLTVNGSFNLSDKIINNFEGKLAFIGGDKDVVHSKTPFNSSLVFIGDIPSNIDNKMFSVNYAKIIKASTNYIHSNNKNGILKAPVIISAVSSVTETHTEPSCYGASDGSVTITASGGTPPYTIQLIDWTNFIPIGSVVTASGIATFNGLASSLYLVSAKDASAGSPFPLFFNIGQPAELLLSATPTNITCNGLTDGKITASASGGTTNYDYTLKAGGITLSTLSSSGSIEFTGLAAGTNYTVEVDDAHGCGPVVSGSLTIVNPDALSGSITAHTDILCFGTSTGSITATATKGTAPYEYSIDGGAYQASGTFNGLAAGNHTVAIRDVNLCNITLPAYALTQPASAVSGSISAQTNVSCFGGNNGAVTVAGAGGVGPYQYSLDGGAFQASGTFGTLTAKTYTVTVKDVNSCTKDVTVTITEPASGVGGSITSQTNVLCFGDNSGSVTVAGIGGTAPYQYSLNGGVYQVSGTFGTLTSGPYTVTVKDAGGCTFPVAVTITQPANALTGSISSQTNVTCFGNLSGSVTVTGVNGTTPYQYSFQGGAYSATNTFNSLAAGK